ncbi:MAG: Flp pilus assembly complex ATPase component TadA [Planctomycetes bacterium]|nr:Flp pilus assembly complex ATPase component TadA [Planctomycetota bacterium]
MTDNSGRNRNTEAKTRDRHRAHERIGQMLLRKGKLRPDQLDHALKMQKTMGGLIGSVLVELGLIHETDLAEALAESLGLELIDLNKIGAVDPDAAHTVPELIARRHRLIGIRFVQPPLNSPESTKIVVAMADPSDYMALDSIRAATNLEPQPAVATRAQVLDALQTAYMESPLSLDEAVGELKDFKIEATGETGDIDDYARLRSEAGLAPVVRFVNSILYEAARMKASDIHIEPQEHHLRCRFRIDGDLRAVAPPPKTLQNAIVSRIKIVSGLDIAEHRLPQDGRLKIKFLGRNIDVRVSTMPTVFGEKVVLRLLDQSATRLNLDELGFEEETVETMRRLIRSPHGIVLLCGPTGCGKSTTLYSFLKELNQTDVNIVTVEDPVEYRIEGVNQTHVKASIGLTFANCLRTILRQDPDIVMVGEVRDLETLEVAVRASLTGHLVFSTLHTNTAVSSVTRMANMGLQPYLISATLNAALSQRLVRKVCKVCSRMVDLNPRARAALERFMSQPVDFQVAQAKGCGECGFTGYRGRLAVHELFEPNDDLREMISRNAEEHLIESRARELGMHDLVHNAFIKLRAGSTTVEEVLSLGFQKGDDAALLHKQRRLASDRDEGSVPETEDETPAGVNGEVIDLDANPPEPPPS